MRNASTSIWIIRITNVLHISEYIYQKIGIMPFSGESASSSGDGSSSNDNSNENSNNPQFEVLDPGSYKRLNDVRKQIWLAGIKGLLFGTAIGSGSHVVYSFIYSRQKGSPTGRKLPPLPKHSFIPTVMIGGALFSFVFSAVSGRVGLQGVGDIFLENAKPKSEYQRQQQTNQRQLRNEGDNAFQRRETAIREAREKKQQSGQFGTGTGSTGGPSF